VIAVAVAGSVVATSSGQAASKTSSTAKRGGEATYGIDAAISGWCFQNALSGGPLGATRMVYESLVERDSKGNFIPHLAKSWRSTQGYKVWTFKIRTGIKFSNGEDFNAEVAAMNIKIGGGHVNHIAPNEKYAGTGIPINANIADVTATDLETLVITLDKPDNQFLGLLYRAGRYVMRAPAQYKDPATCVRGPIGTGPFKVETTENDKTVLVRNELYWRKDAKGTQLPYLDKVTVLTIREASQRAAAVRKGTVDVAYFTVGDATFIKDLKQRKSVVAQYEGNVGQWGQWMPNQGKAGTPFIHKNCRLAVAHGIDWNSYNKVRLKGLGTYTGTVVGKGHALYTTAGSLKFDLAKAKSYVEKCNTDLGAAAPFTLTLYADVSTQSLNNAKFIQGMLEKAGIKFNNIYQGDASSDLIPKIYGPGGNKFDFAQGTPAEGPGSGYIIPFFLSTAFPEGSASPFVKNNAASTVAFRAKQVALGVHKDTKVDELIYAAQAETDKKKAAKKWAAAMKYIQENAIAIPSIHSRSWTFVNRKSNLKGIGLLKNPDGKTFAPTKDIKGLEWTGIWKG
jgi:peptide/nickel transport system substrate-binding protein